MVPAPEAISTLDPRKWRPLFDAVYEMNTASDHADFMAAVAIGMTRMIPCDLCVVHVLDRTQGRLVHEMRPANPFTPEEIVYYQSNSNQNPLVAYYERTGDKRARRVSDVMTAAAWHRSPFYNRTLSRLRLNRFLALPFTIDPTVVAALSFNRKGADFTHRHCGLLDAFAPHFRLAWRRHENPWKRATPALAPTRERLGNLGLTAREAEVLYWMTEGKQNREIATILDRSLHTVQKHVAHIISKLGQENRHSATVHALRWLQRP
jgi:DNA-binding CsgD family transcriptional regulator